MKSVLIIDDDPVVRERLKTQLDSAGYEVDAAEDGTAAVALVSSRPVDLVILDVMMPRKGGVETLIEITQIMERRPATIVITAMDLADSSVFRNLTETFGVRHVFRKPVDAAPLLEAIRELLR